MSSFKKEWQFKTVFFKFFIISLYNILFLVNSPYLSASEDYSPKFAAMDWSPFGWSDEQGSQGLFVEIFNLINEISGMKGTITLMPPARIAHGLDHGLFDYAISYRDPSVFGDLHYLEDIGCFRNLVVSLDGRPVRKLADLHELRVAFSAESPFSIKYAPLLESMNIHIKSFKVPKSETIFTMLIRGRVNAVVVNEALLFSHYDGSLYKKSEKTYSSQKFATPLLLERVPISLIESKLLKSHRYHKTLQQVISGSEFRQGLKQLYKRYGLSSVTSCNPPAIEKQ